VRLPYIPEKFVLSLIFDRVLSCSRCLSDALQGTTLDLAKAADLVTATTQTLEEFRSDESWKKVFDYAVCHSIMQLQWRRLRDDRVNSVPMFGVPEGLLSDCGINSLALVMQNAYKLLGITKLNTSTYQPKCNGMVVHLNITLKAMLHKHAATFGCQWD